MEHISLYLGAIKEKHNKEIVLRFGVKKALKDVCGIDLGEDSILKKGKVLILNVSPTEKSEIFIKREDIKELLSKKLGITLEKIQ